MKSIDYLTLFMLFGSAPTWQAQIDRLLGGLGTALVVLLLLTAPKAVAAELNPRSDLRRTLRGVKLKPCSSRCGRCCEIYCQEN